MAEVSVVRLGPSDNNVSAKLLRTALVSYLEKQQQPPEGSNPPVAFAEETIAYKEASMINISNKYFHAKVQLEEIGAQFTGGTCKEDGIILVFDALNSNPDRPSSGGSNNNSFDALPLAHQTAEDNDTCGDLLRLCVGISLTELSPEELRGKDHEKEYSRRVLWCLDNGYEYVEADLSSEGLSKGHGERDKEGFARIVEAIQGTVWSSAVMSKSKTRDLKESYKEDGANLQKEETTEEKEENPYIPPDPSLMGLSHLANAAAAVAAADESKAELEEKQSTTTTSTEIKGENIGPNDMADLRKDLEAEEVFDKMEHVLKEANRIREASKSGVMTDEERRERAGDAAMALVNLMTNLGFDDDDTDVDDSDDNSSGIIAET